MRTPTLPIGKWLVVTFMLLLRVGLDRLSLLGLLLGRSSGLSGSRDLLLGLILLDALAVVTVGRGPESKVIAQQLHDQGAVTVALLREGIELGNGVIERLLGEVACTIGRVQDLVVEDGEVQGKTQTDGVGGGEFGLGNIGGVLSYGQRLFFE